MIFLNLKTYTESTGDNATKLYNAVVEFQNDEPRSKDLVIVAPNMIELVHVANTYPTLTLSSQDVDNVAAGGTTGWTPAENLAKLGIGYALMNHSEHRKDFSKLVEDIKAIQEKGLKVIVCCENTTEAEALLEANPYAIAYEPKELIGSGISVTTRPEEVSKFVEVVKGKTVALIGAGVSTADDVAKGLELGADGALLASAFVKAEDPKAKLAELLKPLL